MRSSIGRTERGATTHSISMVKPTFRKGFKIDLLPYQEHGIISKLLWPSKNQVLRILPGYDRRTGEFYKQNVNVTAFSTEAGYDEFLSATFFQATVVTKFGSITAPFIADYAPGSPDEQKYAGETVIRNFIRGIMYATSNKSRRSRLKPINEWKIWTGLGPLATLSYDKPSLLMQALIFHTNGRNNTAMDTDSDLLDEDGNVLPLLALVAIDNKPSIGNLCQALVEPADPSKPLDARTNNKFGPMAELDGNQLFLNSYSDPATQRSMLRPSVQAPGKGWNPTPYPLDADVARQLWHPWDDLLQYMTAEEQLELCVQEFGADTVNYVIGTDPKFSTLDIPAQVKQAGFGRYASLVGGAAFVSGPAAAPGTRALSSTIGRTLPGAAAASPAYAGTPASDALPKPARAPGAKPAVFDKAASANVDVSKAAATLKALRGLASAPPSENADMAADAQALIDNGYDNSDQTPL